MNKIKKFSTSFILVQQSFLVAIPTLVLIRWLCGIPLFFEDVVVYGGGVFSFSDIYSGWGSAILGFLSDVVAFAPAVFGLITLIRLFKSYEKGEVFSVQNAMLYNKLAWLFYCDALIVKPISNAILVLAATMFNPVGQRVLQLSYRVPSAVSVMVGIILIFISWVMLEGEKLREEQSLVV